MNPGGKESGSAAPRPWVRVRQIMGTMVSVHVVADTTPWEDPLVVSAVDDALGFLTRVDRVFTTYSETSDIRRLARGEITADDADPLVREILDLGARARIVTQGLFDPWWKGWFDPTGIVKGWSVERAVHDHLLGLLGEGRIEAVGVNAGGDMQLATTATSAWTWQVGIADPIHPGATVARIPLKSGAVATSGIAERGGHIVDPRTGRPVDSVVSASVVAEGLGDADLWATTACVAGFDDLSWIRHANTRGGIVIAPDRSVRRWVGGHEVGVGENRLVV